MFKFIDDYLNRTTMYRLVTYYLAVLWLMAFWFCILDTLPYDPVHFLSGSLFIGAVCYSVNKIFSRAYEVPTNAESWLITALILSLIIEPGRPSEKIFFLFWASALAMASKYILAEKRKHIFNPVAISVVATAFFLGRSATWWVGGTFALMPFVIIGGILIVRKIRRIDMVVAFFAGALASIALTSSVISAISHAPIFFFAFVILTEPLTTPPSRWRRVAYGVIVGILFAPAIHVGPIYSTPELALVIGNVVSYLLSPKMKLLLTFRERREIAPRTYEYVFEIDRPMDFKSGQYMEFTIPSERSDNRGNRRFFTISSSPDERALALGIKFYENSSTFKTRLTELVPGDTMLAGSLSGDFVMPNDRSEKLVFIAGGIGVTPFRSMIRHMLDRNEARDIVILYASKMKSEFAYTEIFEEAKRELGVKTVFVETNHKPLDVATIRQEVSDWSDRRFYISGPHSMVESFKKSLRELGVNRTRVITDYFPGFV
jgi:ferredoxin-NADP reductase